MRLFGICAPGGRGEVFATQVFATEVFATEVFAHRDMSVKRPAIQTVANTHRI
jgi:ethanolamine utilization cobalamin adenosyltransferase